MDLTRATSYQLFEEKKIFGLSTRQCPQPADQSLDVRAALRVAGDVARPGGTPSERNMPMLSHTRAGGFW